MIHPLTDHEVSQNPAYCQTAPVICISLTVHPTPSHSFNLSFLVTPHTHLTFLYMSQPTLIHPLFICYKPANPKNFGLAHIADLRYFDRHRVDGHFGELCNLFALDALFWQLHPRTVWWCFDGVLTGEFERLRFFFFGMIYQFVLYTPMLRRDTSSFPLSDSSHSIAHHFLHGGFGITRWKETGLPPFLRRF
jgi:hypothetical protein